MNETTADTRRALAAVVIALASALFFTLTYVLNRASAIDGGHWAWTASLRYLITLPLLLPLMPWQGGIAPVWRAIRAHPGAWLRCSAIGFVAFYLLLSWAAASGPSWLVAGSFQFTVIAGMLCAPFLYRDARRKVPASALGKRGQDGRYAVRVVLKDNKTETRQVRIGMNNNVQAQVLEGLEVGERVVSADAAPAAAPGA